MRSFFISLKSEFYKSRKTLAFWASVLIPVIICGLLAIGFYTSADKIVKMNYPGEVLWFQFVRPIISIMGMLILPFYVIFMAFSVNNIEHKNDTWKMLFAQPLNKFSIYLAKYIYGVLLILICLLLFGSLSYFFGILLSHLDSRLTFNQASPINFLSILYLKLFISALGIYSIQFILSLIWGDFLKPMGIGFVLTIMGIITVITKWKYAAFVPYSAPSEIITSGFNAKPLLSAPYPILQDVNIVSLVFAVGAFIAGYYILSVRNIK